MKEILSLLEGIATQTVETGREKIRERETDIVTGTATTETHITLPTKTLLEEIDTKTKITRTLIKEIGAGRDKEARGRGREALIVVVEKGKSREGAMSLRWCPADKFTEKDTSKCQYIG